MNVWGFGVKVWKFGLKVWKFGLVVARFGVWWFSGLVFGVWRFRI